MSLDHFHPAVATWFRQQLGLPTEVQTRAWAEIGLRRHTLLAAPTGSGKTLAAFLSAIDDLVREGLDRGLPDETRVLYVSPLKALSHDVQKNLEQPLRGIRDELFLKYPPGDVEIRAWVRTGDTPQYERQKAARKPPHIVVTTPESLFTLLTSGSGRRMLSTVRTVIVDEIHAVAGNKRGSHLSLSLERLDALVPHRLARVGLSATQKPIEQMARFLVGDRECDCAIVDTTPAAGQRRLDLQLELPDSPLSTIMSNEIWEEVYDRLAELVGQHTTTLIFVNTRRLAERAARHLADRIGEDNVSAHHGSLSRRHRLRVETRLKQGQLQALVATSSLELGIDIGDIDLVCQLGSPHGISAVVQRVGRSGHAVGGTPKGRLFPLSQDDLVECAAILGCIAQGELDRIVIPEQPMDVLAQQIVAEVSTGEWESDQLYEVLRQAWPYRELQRDAFDRVIEMLAQGFSTRRGRRGAYLHHDAVNGRLRGRRGAGLVAMTNGGAIPDQFEYEVILQPEDVRIGNLGEDFAFESLAGDIFQLGNISYRINRVETGKVYVEDAHGEPPTVPFWFGEAPGRSDELSIAVSQLRDTADQLLEQGRDVTRQWLDEAYALPSVATDQLLDYLAAAKAALGTLPTQQRLVFERFFDAAGDMHFVIHAPFGSRINRAWGLALRKRFCRKFNFELQAAALEDSLVLSLGPTHSFPLDEVARYLSSASARHVLVQALLDAPMFEARWRWNATIALAVRRNRNGKRVPPQWQRSDAEDLIALVFPDQLACLENIAGPREVPDHPLVDQTIADCLTETMDVDGLERVLQQLEQGTIEVSSCDLNGPSPLSESVITARPYAFLDDAPAEERRTLAIQSRRFNDPADAAQLNTLDQAAIEQVVQQAWPVPQNADELHDALYLLGYLDASGSEIRDHWEPMMTELVASSRATVVRNDSGAHCWVCAERLAELLAVLDNCRLEPQIAAVGRELSPARELALINLLRSRLEGLGPVTTAALAHSLQLPVEQIEQAMLSLEQEGFAVRGHYSSDQLQWCDRRLLARIHRYTIRSLRKSIAPVSQARFERFSRRWQGLEGERPQGLAALQTVLAQLEGTCAAAAAWETDVLPTRLSGFTPELLDQVCAAGRFVWLRLGAAAGQRERRKRPVRSTPISLIARANVAHWQLFAAPPQLDCISLSSAAQTIYETLSSAGALFFSDMVTQTGLRRRAVREALAELVAWGLITSDSFAGIRLLAMRRPRLADGQRGLDLDDAGRWSTMQVVEADDEHRQQAIEHIAMTLLQRYG
ncbi:MAG: DEAD/DEAH box helicase, partial [Gammaproteobacteria bacterium]|nr:DEAD/DEAH box helicase [Gammaproteobacteria bacterium]